MKNLIRLTFITLLLISLFSCSKNENYQGSGELVTETRNVNFFDKIYNEGIAKVNVIQGETQSVKVTSDNNIIYRIITTVSNNELYISLEDGSYENVTIEIDIILPNLSSFNNSGVGDVFINNFNNQNHLNIENSGTGSISISGSGNSLDVFNEGSGNISANDYLVSNGNIEIIGSGDCSIYATEFLNVTIEGSGNVYYYGNPELNVTISGSGEVINTN